MNINLYCSRLQDSLSFWTEHYWRVHLISFHIFSVTDGLWNDVNCENALTFVCKQVYTEPPPYTRAPTPAPTGYCPSGWDQLDHRCYKFYGQNQYDRKSWYEAQENCQAQGADLVIVYDQKIQCKCVWFQKIHLIPLRMMICPQR